MSALSALYNACLAPSLVDHEHAAGVALSHTSYAAIGSIRLASLFLTFPTRALTGQQVISSEGNGLSRALSSVCSAGSSPSQSDHASGLSTAGMRL